MVEQTCESTFLL